MPTALAIDTGLKSVPQGLTVAAHNERRISVPTLSEKHEPRSNAGLSGKRRNADGRGMYSVLKSISDAKLMKIPEHRAIHLKSDIRMASRHR